ncbi:MAG: energy transducer TonB [Rhodocyclaceae bacterium]|nr:energy transducer TonB [Rhodocyclaceae bacterium]
MAPPPARRTAESRPSARAPSTTAHPPTPVLTAPVAAPATEFRVPAAPALPAAPQAAPAAAPTRAPAADAPVTAPRFDADYLENPPPAYPLAARRRGLQGTVRIEVLVARDGRVRDLKVDEGSGHPELDEAALRAVREWRFVPARRGGDPVEASVIVPVRFQLDRR